MKVDRPAPFQHYPKMFCKRGCSPNVCRTLHIASTAAHVLTWAAVEGNCLLLKPSCLGGCAMKVSPWRSCLKILPRGSTNANVCECVSAAAGIGSQRGGRQRLPSGSVGRYSIREKHVLEIPAICVGCCSLAPCSFIIWPRLVQCVGGAPPPASARSKCPCLKSLGDQYHVPEKVCALCAAMHRP